MIRAILKALVGIIAVVSIAFTCFFIYSYSSGNTVAIHVVERVVANIGGNSSALSTSDTTSTQQSSSAAEYLSDTYGLSSSQAQTVVDIAEQLGIDFDSTSDIDSFISQNMSNLPQVKSIATQVENGTISENQAVSILEGILNF